MVTSRTGSEERPRIPQHTSQDTIWAAPGVNIHGSNSGQDDDEQGDGEHSPLLGSASAIPISDNSNPGATVDPTSLYVKILEEHLPWYKRPSAFWLLPVFGLSSITAGMLMSSIGQFMLKNLCREYLNNHPPSSNVTMDYTTMFMMMKPPDVCRTPEIQAYTAKTQAVVEVLGAIAGTLSIGYYASLSDKLGRLKIMIVAVVNHLLMLCSVYAMDRWWDQIGLPLMVIMSLIGGLLGGVSTTLTMSLAYAADCTDPARRSLIYSWLHAGLFLGMTVGPICGGYLSSKTDTIMTIVYIDIAVTLFSLGLLVFFMPESIPSKQSAHIRKLYEAALVAAGATDPSMAKKAQEVEKAAWYSHFFRSLAFFHTRGKNINLILLGAISFLQTLALKGTFSVLILYTFQLFNWTDLEVGALFTVGSFSRLFSLLVILPILVHVYHKRAAKKRTHDATDSTYDQPSRDETEQGVSNSNSNSNSNIYTNNDQIIGFSSMEDPIVASSLEHLGEAALNLSDDEGSFQERRRRQSTVDSAVTWNTDRTRTNTRSGSSASPSSPSPKKSKASTSSPRTREQIVSDLKLDTWIIRLGFLVNSVTYIGYGLATQTWMFFLASALHATSIIAAPSLKTLLTSMVEPSEFGAALGAIQVLESIAGIFSPVVISWVYAMTVKTRPELVWYCCALLTGACTVLAFMIRQRQFVKRPGQASA
ncbi:hypothetical protein EMPS_00625 [Entomortierella parvispora]|uniref:Major facilitator superfamily (MFS) profile domain-containing protein n=1 Tax=Entomortierella parvispora TaxID=205924 RepID=A0A9P3H1A0_9FUNG|nr:hypothetical protein EMPS_00625 [Entomortierella parvispora]